MADPDVEIRGGAVSKHFFRPFGPLFGPKIRGYPGPPGPSPGSATVMMMMMMTTVKMRMSMMTNEDEDDHGRIGECPTRS